MHLFWPLVARRLPGPCGVKRVCRYREGPAGDRAARQLVGELKWIGSQFAFESALHNSAARKSFASFLFEPFVCSVSVQCVVCERASKNNF